MSREDLPVAPGVSLPEEEIVESASRSRGPGGQHVNKTETRVTLHWDAAGTRALRREQRARLLAALAGRLTREGLLVVRCDRFRSRARNRDAARERLAELVRRAIAPPTPRVGTRPTRGSVERRLRAKRDRAERKRRRRAPRDADA